VSEGSRKEGEERDGIKVERGREGREKGRERKENMLRQIFLKLRPGFLCQIIVCS